MTDRAWRPGPTIAPRCAPRKDMLEPNASAPHTLTPRLTELILQSPTSENLLPTAKKARTEVLLPMCMKSATEAFNLTDRIAFRTLRLLPKLQSFTTLSARQLPYRRMPTALKLLPIRQNLIQLL